MRFTRNMFAEMDDIVRRFDAWNASDGGLDGRHGLAWAARGITPRVDIKEDEATYRLTTDLPGVSREGLQLTFEEGVLKIAAKASETDEEGWTTVRTERRTASLERAFRFRVPVDADAIDATLEHGVLTITVPKRGPSVVQIPVSAN